MNRELTVAPLSSGDRCALARFFASLTPRSLYLRFFSPMPTLPKRLLDWMASADQARHGAVGAWDGGEHELVGEARYVALDDASAEVAITVRDDWQGRGVGTTLLDALARLAERNGFCRLTASTLAENAGIRALLERAGFARGGIDAGTLEWERDACPSGV